MNKALLGLIEIASNKDGIPETARVTTKKVEKSSSKSWIAHSKLDNNLQKSGYVEHKPSTSDTSLTHKPKSIMHAGSAEHIDKIMNQSGFKKTASVHEKDGSAVHHYSHLTGATSKVHATPGGVVHAIQHDWAKE